MFVRGIEKLNVFDLETHGVEFVGQFDVGGNTFDHDFTKTFVWKGKSVKFCQGCQSTLNGLKLVKIRGLQSSLADVLATSLLGLMSGSL